MLTPEQIRAIPFYKNTPDEALPYTLLRKQLAQALKGREAEIEQARGDGFTKGITQYREEICPVRIEQAKREEKERTIEFIDWLDNGTRSSASWRSEVRKFRQALKEGKL